MLVIGLTGGIGAGKSTVANLFAQHGVTVIDTDQLARDITQPGTPALKKIVERFGPTILTAEGKLNRSLLRTIIFKNAHDKIWLEELLHPLIRQEMEALIKASSTPYCIFVIPLLFETKPNPLIDRVLVIDTPEDIQISRALIRDSSSINEITSIVNSQVGREIRLQKADDIIYNHGILEELPPQVDKLHRFYLSIS